MEKERRTRLGHFRRSLELFAYYSLPCWFSSQRLRLQGTSTPRIFEGECRFASGDFVFLVVYQENGIPWYLKNLLEALGELELNVFILLNAGEPLEWQKHCHTVLHCDNQGMDFGAYRQGVQYFTEKMGDRDFRRALFLNDSVYYFREGLKDWISDLVSGEEDCIGAFGSWEYFFHIQSFAFSLSAEFFRSRGFQDFWKVYQPVSNRRWCIMKGEIGLSRTLMPQVQSLKLLFETTRIRELFMQMSADEFAESLELLPYSIRRHLHKSMRATESRKMILDSLFRLTYRCSPAHYFGLLAMKHLNLPILKKDLVFRDTFTFEEIRHFLVDLGRTENLRDMELDFMRKGHGSSLQGRERRKFLLGVV